MKTLTFTLMIFMALSGSPNAVHGYREATKDELKAAYCIAVLHHEVNSLKVLLDNPGSVKGVDSKSAEMFLKRNISEKQYNINKISKYLDIVLTHADPLSITSAMDSGKSDVIRSNNLYIQCATQCFVNNLGSECAIKCNDTPLHRQINSCDVLDYLPY